MPKNTKKRSGQKEYKAKGKKGHKLKEDVIMEISESEIPDVGSLSEMQLSDEILEVYAAVTKDPTDLTLIKRLKSMTMGTPMEDTIKQEYLKQLVDDQGYFNANIEFEDVDNDVKDLFDSVSLLNTSIGFDDRSGDSQEDGSEIQFEDLIESPINHISTSADVDLTQVVAKLNCVIDSLAAQKALVKPIEDLTKAVGYLTSEITSIKVTVLNVEKIANSTKTAVQCIERRLGMAKDDVPKGSPLPCPAAGVVRQVHQGNLTMLYKALGKAGKIPHDDSSLAAFTSLFEVRGVEDVSIMGLKLGLCIPESTARLILSEDLKSAKGAKAIYDVLLSTSMADQTVELSPCDVPSTSKGQKPLFMRKYKK